LRIVYNGVDTERFSPQYRERDREPTRARLGVREHETLLLIVAHNFALKGVATLVRSLGQLRAAGAEVQLAVVGGKRSARYERLAEQCGVREAVHFLGPCDDPRPYYAAADLYVQPTFYDPCSLVVLEALASGLPIVTSKLNGAGELIEPGREGAILVDPADDRELTSVLQPWLDRAAQVRGGQAARQLAERHTLLRNSQEIVAVYEEIVARRSGRATLKRAS
jgi:UDP-glucose:(heptosyl)LPS alpha-1,3-glucosyltransferase